MKARALLIVIALLAGGCTPGRGFPKVPEPVPDHASAPDPVDTVVPQSKLEFWFDVFRQDGRTVNTLATDIDWILITATYTATGPVTNERDEPAPSPQALTAKVPSKIVFKFPKGSMALVRVLVTLLHGEPGWKMQCRAILDGIDLPTPGARDAKIMQSGGLIPPVLCEAFGI